MEANSWKILLIDDDPDDYVITKALLAETKGNEFNLRWARNYEEALEVLANNQVDAILMDYDLGERNGVDLIREALSQGSQTPFILLTGRGSYEIDLEAMQAGAVDYIPKGEVNPRLLERAIRYAIERKATENALSKARDELEQRVQERTRELREANEQLARTNAQLEAANQRLEEANAVLQAEIEERLKIEAALRGSETRLRTVVNNAPIVLWAIDKDGNFTFQEGRGLEKMGMKPGELVGISIYDYLSDRPETQELIRRVLAGESIVEKVYSRGIWFETHLSPRYSSDNQVEGVIGVSIDVTERYRDQEYIAYQARLLENVNDAIIATDEQFRLTAWNRAAEAIYGWKAEEVLGRSEAEVLRTKVLNASAEKVFNTLKKTGSLSIDLIHHHRDGRPIRIESKAITLQDEKGKITGYAYVNRDITGRKLAEEQLRQYALRSAALAEISQLLAEAGTDVDLVLKTITRRVAETLGEACVLSLLSDDWQELKTVSVHHSQPEGAEFMKAHLVEATRPVGEGLRSQVIQSGQPLMVSDVPQGPFRANLPQELWPELEKYGIYQLLVVPLRVQGQAIGTLGVSRGKSGKAYDLEDQNFLQNLADRAAQAIANARLFEALKTELADRIRAEALLKSSHQALQESRERLRTVIEGAPIILWAVDREGTYTLYEGKGMAASGLKPGEVVGKKVYEYLQGNEVGLHFIERALSGEAFSAFIDTPEGMIFENHYSPNITENGEVAGVIGVSIDVTDRIRAQERISYLARLLENVNDAIIATDEQFRLTAWNRAAEAIYGWNADEALGHDSFEILKTVFPELDRDIAVRRLLETGSYNGEVIQRHRDGRTIDIETKMIALTDEEGKITGFASVNRDITERKRAERKIRQHAGRSEALADLSRVLAEAGKSVDQVMDVVVRRASEMIGGFCILMLLSPDEQFLIPEAIYHPQPDAMTLLEELKNNASYRVSEVGYASRAVTTGEAVLIPEMPREVEKTGLNPAFYKYFERYGVYSSLIVPLRADGKVIGTLGTARDFPGRPFTRDDQAFLQNIADRAAQAIENARLFEALNKSEARFRAIFEESALGIKLSDLEGRILACNPALMDMLGYSEEDLIGTYFTDLTYADDLRTNKALFQQLINGAISRYRVEKRYVRKDGSLIWARQAVSVVKDEAGTPQFVIAMVENISERKQMEDELTEVRRRLIDSREAERLQLSQEIHDGPMQELYGVSYSIDALKSDDGSPEEQEQLERLQAQLRDIIQALRVICGQLRPPTLAPFGLEKTIRSHAESFKNDNPNIELELDLQPDAQELAESVRLALFRVYQQSLANIVRHAGASHVKVSFRFDAEYITMEISDNGQGFEVPARWVDLVRKGHYGLAGAAERAEAIGGRLEVQSKPGKGTLVRVVVPLN